MSSPRRFAIVLLLSGAAVTGADAEPNPAQMERGARLFSDHCLICHQPNGQGAPPVYPPLAKSDWFFADRARTIRVLCEGLSGAITVNGQGYFNSMPAQVLDDSQAADVLTYAGNSWGNAMEAFTAEEVKAARAKSRFPTFESLVKASSFQPLPEPPRGWRLREVVRLPEFCTRFAARGGRDAYVLAQRGSVYRVDLAAGALVQVIRQEEYLDPAQGDFTALGATFDKQGRLLVVTNHMNTKGDVMHMNEVVIWRSTRFHDGQPAALKPWLQARYPHGAGGFNHGVNHMAFGPDGKLYLNSGSRTDAAESSKDPRYAGTGEDPLTACIWRVDADAPKPEIEVFARGIRNAYGFAWDAAGRLFTVSNGPDYSAPEEMDLVESGGHYGFPFQFSDWPAKAGFPYAHTPVAPAGVKFTFPVANIGPAGGGSVEKPMGTFDPHSSPCGMIWCGDEYPEPLRGGFVMTRFGNLLGPPAAPEDVGFDVLSLHPQKTAAGWQVRTDRVLAPLGRPVDVVGIGGGRLLVMEYTRPTDFKNKLGWLPGRILELAPTTY